MANRVGIYCRLSDEDRFKKDKNEDSESIANQKSMLLLYDSYNRDFIERINGDGRKKRCYSSSRRG